MIYKYLSLDGALKTLENSKLKVSTTNDLFDLRLPQTKLSYTNGIENQSYHLFCFSKRWNIPNMWSLYAVGDLREPGGGVVIGFDEKILEDFVKNTIYNNFNTNPSVHVGKDNYCYSAMIFNEVSYIDKPITTEDFIKNVTQKNKDGLPILHFDGVNLLPLNDNFTTFFAEQTKTPIEDVKIVQKLKEAVIFSKGKPWSYEEEVRYFIKFDKSIEQFSRTRNDFYMDFSSAQSLIKEIYVGPNVSNKDYKYIAYLLNKYIVK